MIKLKYHKNIMKLQKIIYFKKFVGFRYRKKNERNSGEKQHKL